MEVLLLHVLLELPLAADPQDVVLQRDADVLLGQTGQLGVEDVRVRGLLDVDRGDPGTGLFALGLAVEKRVDQAEERIAVGQVGVGGVPASDVVHHGLFLLHQIRWVVPAFRSDLSGLDSHLTNI